MTPNIFRLRCVRCGDWHEREDGDPYLPDICTRCFDKYLDCDAHSFQRFVDRYRRGAERHPTTRVIARWWAKYAASVPSDGDPPW